MGFRAPPDLRAAIIRWAENQPEKPSLSESVRRLVEIGLATDTKPTQAAPERAARAKELASKAIDTLSVGASDDDAKASRKRSLIKGPEEFQEVRVDRPKAKAK